MYNLNQIMCNAPQFKNSIMRCKQVVEKHFLKQLQARTSGCLFQNVDKVPVGYDANRKTWEYRLSGISLPGPLVNDKIHRAASSVERVAGVYSDIPRSEPTGAEHRTASAARKEANWMNFSLLPGAALPV